MYDKKNIEKMATETPKRSLDNQEFIAWKEDVMPSSSTQPPRKVIKRELVAMKTHAGDFEHIWVHAGEKPFAYTQSDEENASAAAEYVENEDSLDVQNILEPIHLAGTTTKNGRWKCPFCPYETKQKHNVTKHIKSKKKEHVRSFKQKKIIKDDVVKNEIE